MNLYQDIVFGGLDVLRGRRNMQRLRFLRRSQFWSAERLAAWQLDRLNALLLEARAHSPFFAARLEGLELPAADLGVLLEILPLRKTEIRAQRELIRTRHLAPWRYVAARTGGSTGEPMHYYWDKRGQDWNRASVYRSTEWAGSALGERSINMTGSAYDARRSAAVSHRAANWVLRHRDCPVGAVTRDDFERYRILLERFRPSSIWGYASALNAFAEHLEDVNPDSEYPYLKALVTSSETLQPSERVRIERVFGTGKVFDHYGSREAYIAAECREHTGYHVNAEVLIVEVVDDDGNPCEPGQRGRVLVTDLSNHAFPLIRYEIGDLAVRATDEPCPCGVSLPRLARVEGRVSDLVVLRDRVLTAPTFCTLFSAVPDGVDAFQIRQDRMDHLRVFVSPGRTYSAGTEDYLRRMLAELVDGMATIELIHDEPIEVPESGKRQFVVSSVARERVA